jgi:chromosome partitioning protein
MTQSEGFQAENNFPPESYLRTPEVANIFNVHLVTFHDWRKRGIVPFPRQDPKSKQYIWSPDDIHKASQKLSTHLFKGKDEKYRIDENLAPSQFACLSERSLIVAFLNHKGGTAKTTCSINCAATLARRGIPTLLVDADTQKNSTEFVEGESVEIGKNTELSEEEFYQELEKQKTSSTNYKELPSIFDVYRGKPITSIIRRSRFGFDYVPGSDRLWELDTEMTKSPTSFLYTLKKQLQTVHHRYPVIIIDCPPNLTESAVLWNVLVAATGIICPLVPSRLSWNAVEKLLNRIQEVKQASNKDLAVYGYLICRYRRTTTYSDWFWKQFVEYFGAQAFQAVINEAISFEDALELGIPVIWHDPKVANTFREVINELLALHVSRYPAKKTPEQHGVVVNE